MASKRCKCKKPQRTKNSAGGLDFFVCAKSKGGCGEEIIDLDFGTFNPYDILDKDCQECMGTGVALKLSSAGYYEARCEHCDGTGRNI